MKSELDESRLTQDELWEWCLKEYQNRNPGVQFLLRRYFAVIREIVSRLGPDAKLLEVGCGAGESSRRIMAMLSRGQMFEVSEVDARYVNKLKETNFPIPVRQESALELKRNNREFDCVFLLEVLEHVDHYERSLEELFRVSRKYVVISVPNEPLWRILNFIRGKYLKHAGNTPGHVNHWAVGELRTLVSKYGDVLKVYTPIPWIILLANVKP